MFGTDASKKTVEPTSRRNLAGEDMIAASATADGINIVSDIT